MCFIMNDYKNSIIKIWSDNRRFFWEYRFHIESVILLYQKLISNSILDSPFWSWVTLYRIHNQVFVLVDMQPNLRNILIMFFGFLCVEVGGCTRTWNGRPDIMCLFCVVVFQQKYQDIFNLNDDLCSSSSKTRLREGTTTPIFGFCLESEQLFWNEVKRWQRNEVLIISMIAYSTFDFSVQVSGITASPLIHINFYSNTTSGQTMKHRFFRIFPYNSMM